MASDPAWHDVPEDWVSRAQAATGLMQRPKENKRQVTMRFDADGRVASFALDLKTAAQLGVIPEDNEGLIDHLRAVRGVIAAVFFEELADGKVRVSMRSKSDAVDVSAICQKFGGGGHKLAAGARIRGTFAEVRERVLEEVCDIAKRNT